jgi:hypothetical protein
MVRALCKMAVVLLLVLGVSSPTQAHEEFTEINFMFGSSSTLVRDGAFDYYSHNDWMGGGYLAAEVEVYDGLLLQLGILMGESRSDLFGQFDSVLRLKEPRLALRYGHTFFDFVRPYASVAATYAFMSTEIDLWSDHSTGYEDGWGDGELGGRFSAGCEVFLRRRVFGADRTGFFKDFTLGLALELGYALTQPFELDGLQHGLDGDLSEDPPLPPGQLDLGQLDRSGFFMSFDLRFYF